MKYITLIIGLLVVGCGKNNNSAKNPAKGLTIENLSGVYEREVDGMLFKLVIDKSGSFKDYFQNLFGDRLHLAGSETGVDVGIAERSVESVNVLLELEDSASESSRRVEHCVPKSPTFLQVCNVNRAPVDLELALTAHAVRHRIVNGAARVPAASPKPSSTATSSPNKAIRRQ